MSFGTNLSLETPSNGYGVSNPMINNNADLNAKYIEAQKAKERQAILAVIAAEKSYLNAVANESSVKLAELTDAMYAQTNQIMPDDMSGALSGAAGTAGIVYLKGMNQPNFKTPIKSRPLA